MLQGIIIITVCAAGHYHYYCVLVCVLQAIIIITVCAAGHYYYYCVCCRALLLLLCVLQGITIKPLAHLLSITLAPEKDQSMFCELNSHVSLLCVCVCVCVCGVCVWHILCVLCLCS